MVGEVGSGLKRVKGGRAMTWHQYVKSLTVSMSRVVNQSINQYQHRTRHYYLTIRVATAHISTSNKKAVKWKMTKRKFSQKKYKSTKREKGRMRKWWDSV
ncbi:unnamed protein product [Heterobilharzia americana]|nr:unnamed protein product [Heterobilharzia americana]